MRGPVAVLVGGLLAASSFAAGFDVAKGGERTFTLLPSKSLNVIGLLSAAPMEDMVGNVQGFEGKFTLDPKNVETFRGEFSCKVEDITTGIPLRDEHMRGEKWLNAAKNPNITFKVTGVKDANAEGPLTVGMTLVGPFTCNGVTKEIEVPVVMNYRPESEKTMNIMPGQKTPGNLVRLRGAFMVPLKDFKIGDGNPTVGEKVAETIELTVSFVATDAGSKGEEAKSAEAKPAEKAADAK